MDGAGKSTGDITMGEGRCVMEWWRITLVDGNDGI